MKRPRAIENRRAWNTKEHHQQIDCENRTQGTSKVFSPLKTRCESKANNPFNSHETSLFCCSSCMLPVAFHSSVRLIFFFIQFFGPPAFLIMLFSCCCFVYYLCVPFILFYFATLNQIERHGERFKRL